MTPDICRYCKFPLVKYTLIATGPGMEQWEALCSSTACQARFRVAVSVVNGPVKPIAEIPQNMNDHERELENRRKKDAGTKSAAA
jgi:hypothetical protein